MSRQTICKGETSGLRAARLSFLLKKEAAEVFLEVDLCMDGKISRESITAVRAAGERREEGRVPVGSLFCLFHSDGSSATCFSFT